jgi:glycosyltransferase involved in cell wall biosynthesis
MSENLIENVVTIVIPCKNEEDYIFHLLEHLKLQCIGNTLIIIADASNDHTREVIENHKGNLNVKVIDGGPVSTAKNNGAKLVTTPYILFIDSDVRFFNNSVISDCINIIQKENLDLIGLRIKCYDDDIRAKVGFAIFNFINNLMKHTTPFAVGAFMLTRTDRFWEYGGFGEKYATSEDFFLSKKYSTKKFKLVNHYFGQDSRRFKKMGYFGMGWYLIKNFWNRNNEQYWNNLDYTKYWEDKKHSK